MLALVLSLLLLLLSGGSHAASRLGALPHLRIDPDGISVSGISSGADFAVQFAVAYSKLVSGVAVYAGEPFHCAVTRFSNDELQTCAEQPPNIQGPGCTPLSAPCEGCPTNTTLIYDHCKNHPQWVVVPQLVQAARQLASQGLIDDPAHLSRTRAYLYRGTLDTVYLPGSVQAAADFFAAFVAEQAQIVFEKSVPSLHAMPTLDYGSPCGQAGSPPAMENCNYDGAGEALQHIYNLVLAPRGALQPEYLTLFDQRRYFPMAWTGLADDGYVYVPPACAALAAVCRLHVVFHGCGMYAGNPAMNTSYALHAGYNQWAVANNIVVLYPQSGGYPLHRRQGSTQQSAGCWDSYGQQPGLGGTGAGYDTQRGVQMQSVQAMIAALAGW